MTFVIHEIAVKRLTVMAPHREWYRTDDGLWATRPWLREVRHDYVAVGGWFGSSANHDFAEASDG